MIIPLKTLVPCDECGGQMYYDENIWKCFNCGQINNSRWFDYRIRLKTRLRMYLGGGRLDMVTEYHLRTGWSKQDLKDAGIELLK